MNEPFISTVGAGSLPQSLLCSTAMILQYSRTDKPNASHFWLPSFGRLRQEVFSCCNLKLHHEILHTGPGNAIMDNEPGRFKALQATIRRLFCQTQRDKYVHLC